MYAVLCEAVGGIVASMIGMLVAMVIFKLGYWLLGYNCEIIRVTKREKKGSDKP